MPISTKWYLGIHRLIKTRHNLRRSATREHFYSISNSDIMINNPNGTRAICLVMSRHNIISRRVPSL
jgi:hypothetical protein